MFFIGIVCGILLCVVILAVGVKIYQAALTKFSPRWYQIKEFSTERDEKTGVYQMSFYLTDDIILHGYTKKSPPQNISPRELEAKIRTYHHSRGYRLFWRYKNQI